MIQVPLHDKTSLAVHMDVPRRVIAFPGDQDIAAPAEFSHGETLPHTVTHVNPVLHSVPTQLWIGPRTVTAIPWATAWQ